MPSETVAEVLAGIRSRLSGNTVWPDERDDAVRAALERLNEAPPETAAEFVLAALRHMREGGRDWATHALNTVVGRVLRRKLPFTEDQVVEMIERVSVKHQEFPFAGALHAAESVPLTPRIAE